MTRCKIKLSLRIQAEPAEDELVFAQQLGMDCAYTWVRADQRDYEFLSNLRRKVEDFGLTLAMVGNLDVGKCDKIHLALPGRDEMIEQFQTFVRNLGRAGIPTTTFTWEPAGAWSSEPGHTRGSAEARRVDLAEMCARSYTHGREYTQDEIWANFEYFMERMLPVAEEAGVRLALHPNDPPVPELGGIPCLIHSHECYERAFAIADSPYLGMEFCVGCWLEGREEFGDVLQAIRHFQQQGKIFIVHFRNVSSPLPVFVETFLDNGYIDMYKVMRAFCEVGYEGPMTLDHTPLLASDPAKRAVTAYAVGYMRALIERAEAELDCRRMSKTQNA